MSSTERTLPQPTDVTRPYWDAAATGRLVVQTCQACGQRQFYPRLFCTECMSDQLEWLQCSGQGTIYTYTVNHRGSTPYFKQKLPYVVAIIDLDEGVRMMANILDGPVPGLRIDARVHVAFEPLTDTLALPQFALDTP